MNRPGGLPRIPEMYEDLVAMETHLRKYFAYRDLKILSPSDIQQLYIWALKQEISGN